MTNQDFKIVESFKRQTIEGITNYIEKDHVHGVQNYLGYVNSQLTRANTSLANDCGTDLNAKIKLYNVPSVLGIPFYKNLNGKLFQIIGHYPDVKIILDSIYIKKNHFNNQNTCFVTTDKEHFFGDNGVKKKDIESLLMRFHLQTHIQRPDYR